MGGPILVWALELQHDIACSVAFKPLMGNSRARDIAAQAFELVALMGGAAYVGMKAKAVFVDTMLCGILRILRGTV